MRKVLILLLFLSVPLTVTAVDGVVEINQAAAGQGDSLFFITTPGSYRLSSDLIAGVGLTAISIIASDVTLDLNGFTISSEGSGMEFERGISIVGENVEIRNGSIRGFQFGVFGPALAGHFTRVINVRSENNHSGIVLQSVTGGFVRGCTSSNSEVTGIRNSGAIVKNNIVLNSGGIGLQLGSSVAYDANVLKDNNDGGSQITSGKAISCNLVDSTLDCPP